MKWINVKDQTPEPYEPVLIYSIYADTDPLYQSPSIEIGYYEGEELDIWWSLCSFDDRESNVYYWMPLPEEPK